MSSEAEIPPPSTNEDESKKENNEKIQIHLDESHPVEAESMSPGERDSKSFDTLLNRIADEKVRVMSHRMCPCYPYFLAYGYSQNILIRRTPKIGLQWKTLSP